MALIFSRTFLSRKYDELYRLAQAALRKHDPCEIRGGSCYSMRLDTDAHGVDPFCCTGCRYLGPKGCTVESLFCKVWVCMPVDDRFRPTIDGRKVRHPMLTRLERIKKVAAGYEFLVFRGSKEQSLEQAFKKAVEATEDSGLDRMALGETYESYASAHQPRQR